MLIENLNMKTDQKIREKEEEEIIVIKSLEDKDKELKDDEEDDDENRKLLHKNSLQHLYEEMGVDFNDHDDDNSSSTNSSFNLVYGQVVEDEEEEENNCNNLESNPEKTKAGTHSAHKIKQSRKKSIYLTENQRKCSVILNKIKSKNSKNISRTTDSTTTTTTTAAAAGQNNVLNNANNSQPSFDFTKVCSYTDDVLADCLIEIISRQM